MTLKCNKDLPALAASAVATVISAATALAADSTADSTAAAAAPPPVIKSPTDAAQYRVLRLDNGLTALLVSDPDADKAAAALDVNIGNGSDPDGWNGLAHFLEHMLFLGTEKYPQAGAYQKFIADHGGSTNAYTSFAHTNYHFEVGAAHLLPALDRFAQFFIAPTFDAAFVERERQVVHSEYQARRKDEFRRAWSARRQALNPAHPASRFSTGSAHTLRDRAGAGNTVREQLIAFYRRHYSANLMTLAVVGKEPLIQLEHWVARLFAAVPNRSAEAARFEMPYLLPESLPARLEVRPQKEMLRAAFVFPIASVEAHYRAKPLTFVAGLIGHEGRGSLLAELKSRGWARGLSAGAGYMDEAQGAFEVAVELTEAGLARVDAIGELLFRAVALVEAGGVEQWRQEELRALADIEFRFAERRSPAARARSLAARLHRYPPEEVLRAPYWFAEFRPDLIRDLLSDLRPDNVLVQVVSPAAETDAKTPYYDADYALDSVPAATVAKWKNARGGGDVNAGANDDAGANAEGLTLPPPNPFIPERLTPHPLPAEPHTIVVPRRLDLPADGVKVDAWYLGDPDFNAPRAVFLAGIESPAANADARRAVLSALFVRLVKRRLDALGYPARLAGLDYSVYRHRRGISIRIGGYEDKQPAMLAEVLRALFAPNFDADEFALAAAALKRNWNNAALESPSNQSAREIYRLLLEPDWSEAERLAVIDSLAVADLESHAAALLKNAAMTTLAHGDVTRERAVEMNQLARAAFAESAPGEAAPTRVRRLPAERVFLRSLDVDHDDTALLLYFQGADKTIAERAKMRLLARLMEAPFFFDLRTTHRVGYLVHAAPWEILEVPGLAFSVQSPSHSAAEIATLIGDFLTRFGATLAAMPEADFSQTKRGLIERINARDQQLGERSSRFWHEIARRRFDFDTRLQIIWQLDELSRDAMREFYRRVIMESPRKLLVQSPGRRPRAAAQQLGGGDYTRAGDAEEFGRAVGDLFPAY